MENVIRMNFKKWCELDPDDNRRIIYEKINGYKKCTSDNFVDWEVMEIIRNSKIEKLELIDNEWHVWLTSQ